jgi:glycosyltransferase involved in cell wall biosynthesis
MPDEKRIAILISNPETGGVERMLVNLAQSFVRQECLVDLLVGNIKSPYLKNLDERITLVSLGSTRPSKARPALCAHLSNQRPAVLLAAKDEDCALAGAVKQRLAHPPRCYLRVSVDYSGQLLGRRAGALKRWWRYRQVRRWFGEADALICVSQGVAQDIAHIFGRKPAELHVLPNPTITPELALAAAEPLAHPWFASGQPPVVLGVGRLAAIKNFPLLVRAFARVRAHRDCRLVILGEGRHRALLQRMAAQLGVADAMDLPGFEANPYAYMSRAAVFVLSSSWEGSPNVLVEAMACGTPVVATDCPSGPREILQDGKLGPLVPMDDELALSKAILRRLQEPRGSDVLRAAVERYSVENSSRAYLRAFGME